MLTKEIHEEGVLKAREATKQYISAVGPHPLMCGFSWVVVMVKGNTKIGKSFIAQGFKKHYHGGYYLWNPSGWPTQDMSAKMAGTREYVETIEKYLPEVSVYANSKLD